MHIFFLFKKAKHICFYDTNNVTNIISYNINSYLFERHQKYGILITKFVIEYKKPTILILFMLLFQAP